MNFNSSKVKTHRPTAKSPTKLYFDKAADVPNNRLPLLLFRSVVPANTGAKARVFRRTFRKNDWVGIWTDTIYDYTHYHSNAHEVLGIAEGTVRIQFGGESGRVFRLKAGDMVVIPAGVGHRRIGADGGLKVIGAYPRGQSHYDIKRRGRTVPKVPLPKMDPFYGELGPTLKSWSMP